MVKEKPVWYEAQAVKDMMGSLGGKAVRGVFTNYISSRIYTGKVGLIGVTGYLEATIEKEDRRALIICDEFTQRYAKKVTDQLESIDMEYKVWPNVIPEVPMPIIEDGVKVCEEFKPKVLIAIGGGSVMDATKMILVKYEKPKVNLLMILPLGSLGLRKKVKYFIAIPTTSGTGAEVTSASVITDTDRVPPKKIEVLSDETFSDITILDTYFVKDMPPFLTMSTGLDAFAHSVGSYAGTNWGTPYVDAMNTAAIKEILKYLPRAYKYGARDLEARAHMQMAATMAGIGFGNSIAGIDHSLGHSFGKIFGVHHGISVAMFIPYSIEFQRIVSDRWKELCPIFGIDIKGKDNDDLFKEFIQAIKNFMHSLDAPTCIKDLKNPVINREEYFEKLDILANYADNDVLTLFSNRSINPEIYKKIYEYAWDGKAIDF